MFKPLIAVPALALILACAACEQKPAATSSATPPASAAPSVFPASLFVAAAPAGAKDVKAAKAGVKAGDKVVLVGRIGGSEEPFVEGRAMFTVVDLSLKYCGEIHKDDHCKTPWDYCCEPADDLAANSATVQVTDADGKPMKSGLMGVNGLKPLAVVTVAGTVSEAADGNVVVRAEGIHVGK